MRCSTKYLVTLSLAAVLPWGCERGDWLGPVERGARALFNGWDMWSTEASSPYEGPMPAGVPGTVPAGGRPTLAATREALSRVPKITRIHRGALTYRRYCYHCHGPNGAGRIIVGESLDVAPTDLRSQKVLEMGYAKIWALLHQGGKAMPPLSSTMSPEEMALAIEHLEVLRKRTSRPAFPPRNTKPLQ